MTERPAAVDLTTCDQEPIHVPEHVQAIGYLLAADPRTGAIVRAGANVAKVLGMSAEALVGTPLAEVLAREPAAAIAAVAERLLARPANPEVLYSGDLGPLGHGELSGHGHDGRIVLEVEPAGVAQQVDVSLSRLNEVLRHLSTAEDLDAFGDALVRDVRAVLGYDRVMLYRFAPDWHGWVAAEAKDEDLESFLGLHYPASDIPRQARALFLLNRVRLIADVLEKTLPLSPARIDRPLDLSYAVSRAASPIHIEYLRNMGVRASLTMGLQRRGELWGMIACHHYRDARHLGSAGRAAAELIAQTAEYRAGELLMQDEARHRAANARSQRVIALELAQHEELGAGLRACSQHLLPLCGADGFHAWLDGPDLTLGVVPDTAAVARLVDALEASGDRGICVTQRAVATFPGVDLPVESAAGLLALPLASQERHWLLWFRPEHARTVHWAGDPNKPVQVGPLGPRLTPRQSFELWKQDVRGEARPWSEVDIEAADGLRTILSDVVFRERARLLELTATLAERNIELDAFSAMASHDLREPVRAIGNYARFLREDLEAGQPEDTQHHLDSIERLVRRMYTLIEGLILFARVGHESVVLEPVEFGRVLDDVLEDLREEVERSQADVQVVRPLPKLVSWELGLREILSNLIVNAIKYSRGRPRITIATVDDSAVPPARRRTDRTVFLVRDEGVGIAPENLELVFGMFRSLTSSRESVKGSGLGLAIVRKLVERLGGEIWVESSPGVGSMFYFSLPRQVPR